MTIVNKSFPATAPRPKKSSVQRVIYNIVHDAPMPMSKKALWKAMPDAFHKPHGFSKFSKALTNLSYRGFLVNVGTGRTGIYRMATKDEYLAKQRKLPKSKRAKATKANGSITDDVVGRIDDRIAEISKQLDDLKALRALVQQANL